jgi:hypothetical protein
MTEIKHPPGNAAVGREIKSDLSVPVSTSKASECPICLSSYEDPRNLPCGHVACAKCLPLLPHASTTDHTLRLCWSRCTTSFSIADLPRAYALNALVHSRIHLDWKPPQIHELFLIDTSSSMVLHETPTTIIDTH